MEITKLIETFRRLLPYYKTAYENNYSAWNLIETHLDGGLCYAASNILNVSLYGVTDTQKGYYKHYITVNNCIGIPSFLFPVPATGKDLKSRIDFMESEIISLNKLLEKGYTHV